VGHRRLRLHQIDLIVRVGAGLAQAVRLPGVSMLLRLSRGPARATGLGDLQGFLERGFAAFALLGDAATFLGEIQASERASAKRLFAGKADPFGLETPSKPAARKAPAAKRAAVKRTAR
jgi:hypothetical protein